MNFHFPSPHAIKALREGRKDNEVSYFTLDFLIRLIILFS